MRTFLLGERRVDVKRERIDILAERGDDERHPLRHQPGDEADVAADQAVELGDADRNL